MSELTNIGNEQIQELLHQVMDPEIPVLSVVDLGIIRDVQVTDHIIVTITPTYSGCPAMNTIEEDIVSCLKDEGYHNVEVKTVLSPAWTTDWISQEGRNALEKYGIAPPLDADADKDALLGNKKIVKCTNCGSQNTKLVSQFGSTACKAQFQCDDCQEPFDYFKCLK